MYDAIVVGARCAGAPTAMLLGRKGHRVLLVDRSAFPSDIPHGHFIHRRGPHLLHKWGLLDRIAATGCPLITHVLMDGAGVTLVGKNLLLDGVALGCGTRRTVLDKLLVDAAIEAQVEMREQFTVEAFISDGDRITGIRGRAARCRTAGGGGA